MSRSGFYRWPRDSPGGADPWAELGEAVLEAWEASRRRFGFRKVHARLEGGPRWAGRFGGVTRYRVRKRVRELGIRGICPNASKTTTVPDGAAPARPDLVRRDFDCPVPTCRLVGDITYLRTTAGLVYLATVIDLATRMVVGWAVADNMRAQLVVSAMGMAWSRGHVAGNAIFHSDYAAESTKPQNWQTRSLRRNNAA